MDAVWNKSTLKEKQIVEIITDNAIFFKLQRFNERLGIDIGAERDLSGTNF